MWRDMEAASPRHSASQSTKKPSLAREAQYIESLMKDGLVGRAVAAARGCASAVVTTSGAADALRALFPPGTVPAKRPPLQVERRIREALEAAARTSIVKHPRRKGPAPNGSRFDHWGTSRADSASVESAVRLTVRFLMWRSSS